MGYPVDPNVYYNIEGFGTMQSFRSFPHTGDDWTTYKGQALPIVKAVYGGVILEAWFESGAGNQVVLAADDGGFWVYGHLASFAVQAGQRVSEGQAIGRMGNTGFTTGAHLHLMRYTVEWAARSRYVARVFPQGSKLSQATIAAFARDSYLTDPAKHYGSKSTPTKPPAKTQEQRDQEDIMGAVDDIKAYTREQILNSHRATRDVVTQARDAIRKYVDQRVETAESRLRSEIRGYVFFDAGEDGTGSIEQSPALVLINAAGLFVLTDGARQVASMGNATGKGMDYRWLDAQRATAPLRTSRFWNRVKDSLTQRLVPHTDGSIRRWSVDEAKAWVDAQRQTADA